ncbi:MAG: hypothetical protein ACP5VR_10955, partial [Acidimicrobiales bacterium]
MSIEVAGKSASAADAGSTVRGTTMDIATTLRLTTAETEALRRKAAAQRRFMQEVARDAVRA